MAEDVTTCYVNLLNFVKLVLEAAPFKPETKVLVSGKIRDAINILVG